MTHFGTLFRLVRKIRPEPNLLPLETRVTSEPFSRAKYSTNIGVAKPTPEIELLLNKPHGFWQDRKQQRIHFDKIAEELDLQDWTDWYKVSSKEVIKLGGSSILTIYRSSIRNAVMSIYPERRWEPEKFSIRVSKNYWSDGRNQRKYFDSLFVKLGLRTWEDWYEVTHAEIQENNGTGILHHFGNSAMIALMHVYPEYSWKLHKFTSKLPETYWKNKRHIKEFFDGVGEELGVKKFEDWYPYTEETIRKYASQELWKELRGTHIFALIEAYPQHNWKLYNFSPRFPKKYLSDDRQLRIYLEQIAKQFDIKHWEDWYYISVDDIVANHGGQILRNNEGSLMKVLMKVYPQHSWDPSKRFFHGKSQMALLKMVQSLFPVEKSGEIFMNYLHPDLIYDKTKVNMELDIYLPRLNLAFEFQGQQHYEPTNLFVYDVEQNTRKADACQSAGITLIPIPYWWDKSLESLVATINRYRPDLISDPGPGTPIPDKKEKTKRRKVI